VSFIDGGIQIRFTDHPQYVSWAGPYAPIDSVLPLMPRLTYQTYFRDHIDKAAQELELDVRRSLRALYLDLNNPPPIEFLTSREAFLDAYSETKEV
jgi:soluble epoxide hydrolase/lipid-phosphate phosphatase